MRIVERFPAGGFFSGERRLVLRSLPLGARVTSARFVLTPLAPDGSIGPAPEVLNFAAGTGTAIAADDPARPVGARKTQVTAAATQWVELAFDGRRIADRVAANGLATTNLAGASLQADIGGVFVRINNVGAILADDDPPFTLPATIPAGGAALPGLAAPRLRLTAAAINTAIDLGQVTLRAIAANPRLTIGATANAFVRPGELLSEVETSDLAQMIQLAIDAAEDPGTGFAEIPIALAIDGTGRIAIDAEIDYETSADLLGTDLAEANLEYGHDGAAAAADDLLVIRAPAGMQVAARGSSVDLVGAFEGSEIVRGKLVERAPPGSAVLPAGRAFAQPFGLEADADVDALDVMVATTAPRSRLQLDLRSDLDGKPGTASLLGAPAIVDITDARHASAAWTSVRLSQAVQIAAKLRGKPARWWLVTQCLEGGASLAVAADAATDPVPPQASDNGGLSWRAAEISGRPNAPEQLFRLRRQTRAFKIPVRVEIGRGTGAEQVSLDTFQPLGRVDFSVDGARIAGAANKVIAAARANACPRGEQLVNGDFADRDRADGPYSPDHWTVSGVAPSVTSMSSASSPGTTALVVVLNGDEPSSLSQVLLASGGCNYELTLTGFAFGDDAQIEAIWRRGDCGVARVDTLIPATFSIPDVDFATTFGGSAFSALALSSQTATVLPSNRLRMTAPEDATGLEVRLQVLGGSVLVVDGVALEGTPPGLLNRDLLEITGFIDPPAGAEPALPGWQIDPPDARLMTDLLLSVASGRMRLLNGDPQGRDIALIQTVDAVAGAPVALAVTANGVAGSGGNPPRIAVLWLDGTGSALAPPVGIPVTADGGGIVRLTTSPPAGAASFSVRLEIPPGASLTVTDVSLEHGQETEVPVSFLAEAPGRLSVRDFRIAFEPASEPDPVTPEGGLCAPTPAGQVPGDDCSPDAGCCCGKPRPVAATPQPRISSAVPATQIGFNALTRVVAERSLIARLGDPETDARLSVAPDRFLVADAPLIAVAEVGTARSAALASIGITTPRALALASPQDIAPVLDRTTDLAVRLIENAREFLVSRGTGSGGSDS